ncbi:hypothetical protein B0H63DRAFT_513184 [Podospora didyma]|uniref:Uncharacterized protein n=1 Tax=Podospora didyma TaxID=330526 RepID=A0AAE0N8Z2_9PEZI|nr:hypothetical protein B0H63DRAFT_513184 [Podospora didyma]
MVEKNMNMEQVRGIVSNDRALASLITALRRQQTNLPSAALHADYVSKSTSVVAEFCDPSNYNTTTPQAHLLYVTYKWIVASDIGWSTKAQTIILDDVHAQTVDQEIACFKLSRPGTLPPCTKIIMISAYLDTQDGASVAQTVSQLTKEPSSTPPSAVYLGSDRPNDFIAVKDYSGWVTSQIKRKSETAKPFRALVFALSASALESLRTGLEELAPMNETPVLDQDMGKSVLSAVVLPKDQLRFLSNHGCDRLASCQVFYAFKQEWHDAVKATARPFFLDGDCLDYILKAVHVKPNSMPFENTSTHLADRTDLRLFASNEMTMWAITQLGHLGLIKLRRIIGKQGYILTETGNAVVAYLNNTSLDLKSSLLIAVGTQEPPSPIQRTLLKLAVLGSLSGPILQPADDPSKPHLTAQERKQYKSIVRGGISAPFQSAYIGDLWSQMHFWLRYRQSQPPAQINWRNVTTTLGAGELEDQVEQLSAAHMSMVLQSLSMSDIIRDVGNNEDTASEFIMSSQSSRLKAYLFNIVLVHEEMLSEGSHNTILMGLDVYSTRRVRLDPKSIISRQILSEQLDQEDSEVLFLSYTSMHRLEDGSGYEVSGLFHIDKYVIAQVFNHLASEGAPITTVIGNILSKAPLSE